MSLTTATARSAAARRDETRAPTMGASNMTGGTNGRHREETQLQQLRHHTRNALQRIVLQIWDVPDLQASLPGRQLLRDVEQRMRLSMDVSDALFGLTRQPGLFPSRLKSLCTSAVQLLSDPDQIIELDVKVEAAVPRPWEEMILRIAYEMVGNAVKHGLHVRLLGRISVSVAQGAEGLALTVRDDGWGPSAADGSGEGLQLMRAISAEADGKVSLERIEDHTVARLVLPREYPAQHAAERC
ncbi:ATP-binding protein [Roseomonas elaeocarpi]|uniref:ATP-binding protein n=1 Tax=Roseomonas elaeocarpi TaxID=907779 RepID=A0ABV6JUB3_9PROT